MKYEKPELVELGNATYLVELTGRKAKLPLDPDGRTPTVNPAYDPEE